MQATFSYSSTPQGPSVRNPQHNRVYLISRILYSNTLFVSFVFRSLRAMLPRALHAFFGFVVCSHVTSFSRLAVGDRLSWRPGVGSAFTTIVRTRLVSVQVYPKIMSSAIQEL
ncbi:hypothetical protein EDB87DRAFT_131547 [Lactarius vividus]|nr:hypothetical protein EDB87DRAFT_131547 [Lactarius vividus]